MKYIICKWFMREVCVLYCEMKFSILFKEIWCLSFFCCFFEWVMVKLLIFLIVLRSFLWEVKNFKNELLLRFLKLLKLGNLFKIVVLMNFNFLRLILFVFVS